MPINSHDLEIERIRQSGVFGFNPADITTELHVAAGLEIGRRAVIEGIIDEFEEPPACRGNRYIFRWEQVGQWADEVSGRKARRKGKKSK